MTEHTKGPWTVEHDYKPFVIRDRDGSIVCVISGQAAARPEAADRARLIAAAPDMLEALKEAVDGFEAIHVPATEASSCAVKSWRVIISKTEGK